MKIYLLLMVGITEGFLTTNVNNNVQAFRTMKECNTRREHLYKDNKLTERYKQFHVYCYEREIK